MTVQPPIQRLSTGVAGLDAILLGGFIPQRGYLVRGGPGSGKTTLGLHFLAAGTRAGERCLYISLEEPEERIRANAALCGLDLADVGVLDISPSADDFTQGQRYDLFAPGAVEREPMTRRIIAQIEATRPQRVFLDPMTQFRYLTADAFEYRRQVVSLLRYLVERGATVLYSSEKNASLPDDDLQFMADGVIDIDSGPHGRAISVTKLRGSDFRAGPHTLKLVAAGAVVFPRLEPIPQPADFDYETLSSGLRAVDTLMSGGIERGTVNLITGPTGVGKTTLGLQFMCAAAERGDYAVIYAFEEEAAMLLRRSDGIGLPARSLLARERLNIRKIEPLQYTPDEFAALVIEDVDRRGARIVMIDGVTGYNLSLRGDDLQARMHALCKYLQNRGVAVILLNEQEVIVGDFRATEMGLSYLADSILFLRYLEMGGELRRAIGVLKKRLSDFEKTLREFRISQHGIEVGEPLIHMSGILRGSPQQIPAQGH